MARSITKAELLDSVSQDAGVTKTDAEGVLSAFFDLATDSARAGDKIGWPGFGSFRTTARPARTGRNPRTGAPVKIKASTAMKFTPSSTLKENLNSRKKATKKKAAAKKRSGTTTTKAAAKKGTAKKSPAKKRSTAAAKAGTKASAKKAAKAPAGKATTKASTKRSPAKKRATKKR